MLSACHIALGAVAEALLRWRLGVYLNPIFLPFPFGTLAANLLGCFLMGVVVFLTTEHSFVSYQVRLAITTGFLGSLTPFLLFLLKYCYLYQNKNLLGLQF